MAEAARKSESEKLQAIMNALLLPVPGEPATGTKRFRQGCADVPATRPAPAAVVARSNAAPLAQPVVRAAEPVVADLASPILVQAPRRRSSLFVAPVEIADAEAKRDESNDGLRRKGPLFAAAVEEVSRRSVLSDLVSLVEANKGASPIIRRKAKVVSAGEVAAVLSEIMAAVLELTVVEPMRDAMVSFETAVGETSRQTQQRGRAGKMPKQGRTTKTAKTSMAMAMRDAARLSHKIAAARAEDATARTVDKLRDELLQTRRRCQSPAYAKALREALPIVLPAIVPLGASLPPPGPPASPPASGTGLDTSTAGEAAAPVRQVHVIPPASAACEVAPRSASVAIKNKSSSWKKMFFAASAALAAGLLPAQQSTVMTAEAELIAPAGTLTGSLGQNPIVAAVNRDRR